MGTIAEAAVPTKPIVSKVTIQVLNKPYDKQFTSIVDTLVSEFGVEVSPVKGRVISLSNVPLVVLKEHPEWVVTNIVNNEQLWSFNGLNLTDKQLSALINNITRYSKNKLYITNNRIVATVIDTLPYLRNISGTVMDQLIRKLCKMIGQPAGVITEQPSTLLGNSFLSRVPANYGKQIMEIALQNLPPNTNFVVGDTTVVYPETPVVVLKHKELYINITGDTVEVETESEKIGDKTTVYADMRDKSFTSVEALTYFARLMIACIDGADEQTKIKIVSIVNDFKLENINILFKKYVNVRVDNVDARLAILSADYQHLVSEKFTMEHLGKDSEQIIEKFKTEVRLVNAMPDVKVLNVAYIQDLSAVVLLEFGPSVMCLKNHDANDNRLIPGYIVGVPFSFLPTDNPFIDMYSIFINAAEQYSAYHSQTQALHPHARGANPDRFWLIALKLLGLEGRRFYKTCLGTFATELSNYYRRRELFNMVGCIRRWTKYANPSDYWGELSRRFTHIKHVKVNEKELANMSKFVQEKLLDEAFKRGIKSITMPKIGSQIIQINSD